VEVEAAEVVDIVLATIPTLQEETIFLVRGLVLDIHMKQTHFEWLDTIEDGRCLLPLAILHRWVRPSPILLRLYIF